ncbi:hypothetical protein EMPS_01460 [Entomortierella parvispora]|uniref:PH domain-containing protein n=1 Tax=Entomortierella parvispora TaxID=205924 RepID=A0A9P3LSP7_9FUNG|nr:hypothetical protein EMPS_01460 [Entomortierella parvispora]
MAESMAEVRPSPQQSPRQPSKPSTLATLETVAQARSELEARLTGIHDDLQLTQTIGLLFVKRQEDLKNCFDQLQQLNAQEQSLNAEADADAAKLPESFREQLAQLDREFQEGQNGIEGLKGLIDAQLPQTQSTMDLSSSRSGSILAPSAFPSTSTLPAQTITKPRRHKVVMNSTPSANDAAFPLQIQEELLNQVRYWTSQAEMKEKLNQEYDTKITEQERIIDALNKQRRLREENEERQKEDQWNLELQNQELRNQNTELQQQLSRAGHENAKIQKAFASATEQLEQLKDKEEKTANQLEIVKQRHEQDMTTMRKHMTGIQREKSELLSKVEDLNTTMTLQQQKLSKKATLEAIALAQEMEEKERQELEYSGETPILIQAPARLASDDTSSASALAATATEPKIASLARETSFAHQQSIISELQSKLGKEITEKEELISAKEELLMEKEELVKLLADREETIETMRLEGAAPFEHPSVSKRSSMALIGGHGSRHASDMGHLDDHDQYDHRDLSMSLSDNNSHDFSTGRASPFPAGGLFAELAQATSSNNIKSSVEYKDQEMMTEPIESWVHTVPGIADLIHPTPAPIHVTENESVDGPSVPIDSSAEAAITGKTGTETKAINSLEEVAAHDVIAALGISAAQDALSNGHPDITKENEPHTHSADAVSASLSEPSSEQALEEPVPRVAKSDVVLDEERRHTCDMSQTIIDTLPMPPVPAIPKDFDSKHSSMAEPETRDFKVSIGSAFGGNSSATDTGKIQTVYTQNGDAEEEGAVHNQEEPYVAPVAAAVAAAANEKGATAASPASPALDKVVVLASTEDSIAKNGSNDQKGTDNATDISTKAEKTSAPPTTIVSVLSSTTYTYDHEDEPVVQPQVVMAPVYHHHHHHHIVTDASGATVGRDAKGPPSPSGSISTISTEYQGQYRHGRRMSNDSSYELQLTTPTMIQLITQTMIGDYLWKYTRRRMANMMSEKRHRRYVWIHPYNKTMYWSLSNPGDQGAREQKAKSAFILAVFQISNEGAGGQNSDAHNVSLLVQTTSRNIKLTAPNREKHEMWFQSITYLLSRPNSPGVDIPSDNQTWSEVQANGGLATSSSGIANDAVLNLRQQSEKANSLHKKGSLTRLHGMFRRNSSTVSLTPSGVGSPRISPSGLAASNVTTTTGASDRQAKTQSVVGYPSHLAQSNLVGGNGTVNGGSILAQAQGQHQHTLSGP